MKTVDYITISCILRTKANRYAKCPSGVRNYAVMMLVCMVLIMLLSIGQRYPSAVEKYYSQGFYPYYSYLPKMLVGWIPFSLGDLFYVAIGCFLFISLGKSIFSLFRKQYPTALRNFLRFTCCGLFLYVFFYLSWGLNYYRQPLHQHLGLQMADTIRKEDYLEVLDKYIQRANQLREELQLEDLDRTQAKKELEKLMEADALFAGVLSKTQVRTKAPISSELISYFTVTGYFNPFTQEVQVNQQIPIASYPFTVVHELAHQMGIGFEDECNFIAFLKLKDHAHPWYAYAASYETIQYMLRPLYLRDNSLYQQYFDKLSPLVKSDFVAERNFWRSYSGWFNTVTDFFYNGYLKHNNQPEGMERYSMMSRLVMAWEMRKQ